MKVFILIPDQILASFDADQVIIPTGTGFMGVLDNHYNVNLKVVNGILLIQEKSEWSSIALGQGGAVIQKGYSFEKSSKDYIKMPSPDETCVVILVENAEFSINLDSSLTHEEYVKAQAKLASAKTRKEEILTELSEKRARIRYQATQLIK